MAKISARNNELLKINKDRTSPKIYSLLVELVNDDREELAQIVLRVDYLLQYANTCIKHKDNEEARETLIKAKERIDALKAEGANTEHLEYIYVGISDKVRT
jgi:Na+/phosphate symporter